MLRVQLGPVQDFIAAARTSRDLWSGSYLLSWLMAKAVQAVQAQDGARVIFPCAEELKICRFCKTGEWEAGAHTPCLSNKLIAYVPTGRAEETARAVKEAVHAAWRKIADDVWQMLPDAVQEDRERKRRYDIQVEQHLCVDYAHLPMDTPEEEMGRLAAGVGCLAGDAEKIPLRKALDVFRQDKGKGYAAMYYLVDHLLNGVRKVRTFEAWNAGQGKDAGWYAGRDLAKDYLTGKEEQVFRLEQDARLCGDWPYLGFFKSHRHDVLGAITLIKRLWYVNLMKEHESELPELDAEYGPNDEELQKEDNHYYAVLAMDGDRIGAALTREPKFDVDEKFHRDFSSTLAAFAQGSAGNIVKAHHGYLVYAGGDDVLALLPLQQAIPCAKAVRDCFRDTMKKELNLDMDMSAGLAFAHSKAPLQDVVAAARGAEGRAKGHLGRGAFSVRLMKRSGEIAEWGSKWENGAIELLDAWRNCLDGGLISAKGAHRYAELLTPYLSRPTGLVEYDADMAFTAKQAVEVAKLEFESMLQRQWTGPAGSPERVNLLSCLFTYADSLDCTDGQEDKNVRFPVDELVPMCSVVAFMGRKPNDRKPNQPKEI